MADKTYLSNEINFNEPPICWAGMEVFNDSNLYGNLNVVKNPEEPFTPDINTDGNVNVKKNVNVEKNVNINKNLKVNGQSTFNKDVKINKRLTLAKCGDVAKRIDRADQLPRSDKNLKTNIIKIDNALDKVMQLQGVEFDFINDANFGYLKNHQIGLIAQEVEKVIPEVVGKNLDGTLGVSYGHLVSLLIEAIKDQQEQINDLKKIVNKE
jgi:hypothetical protein